ncbi:hypothetical protein [Methylobacterium sp. WSM2598]|uniref:hypothetical protein n=1 Tax=Methylobacterium sp. WSM2598 TaxID=398261 RepID=UPI0012F675D1|nr:hypothetical protein [Methylobacterium sp. WSM2598]
MSDPDSLGEGFSLISDLAEDLAFQISADLLCRSYEPQSRTLRLLARVKQYLDHNGHPAGPGLQEAIEIAEHQGALSPGLEKQNPAVEGGVGEPLRRDAA